MARSSVKASAAPDNSSSSKKKAKVPAVVVSAPSDTEQGSSPSANDAQMDSHSDLSPSSSPPAASRKKSVNSKKKQTNGHAESKVQPVKKSGPADDEYHPGFTEAGDPFMVPPTTNFVQNFLQPSRWHIISFFTVGFWAVMCWSTLFGTWGMYVHISVFMFWRFCYNIGLGVLLDKQSKRKVITRWYERHTRNRSKLLARLLLHIVNKGVPKGTKAIDYPVEFQAWLAYRALVDLVLINDSTNYIMLGIKCFTLPETIGWQEILQYLVGSFLAIFNYWAKVDAHRCIGDYCWYWGDFFFRKDVQLTFDGIFELFPHPMYTVGYSLYYGYSLICRSYTMLFVSLIAHSMQMLFLFFVEEPHIERTYGNSNPTIDPNQYRVLYDPKTGLFPGRAKKTVFHMNWDHLRRADISLYCLIAYGVMGCILLDQNLVVIQVVVWRLIHWICLGYSLWAQSHRQQWTRYYTQRGRTLYEAFDNWKRVFHTSLTMNNLVFVGCALRFVEFESWRDLLHPWNAASVALGCTLILFSLWSSYSTFSVVGDFGWFYGDFFIPPESFRPTLVYTGIYRFLNNPDCVVGYAGLYGLALITQSWRVFSLALGSQLLNIIFLNVVEIPHMQKLYQQNTRKDGPLARVVAHHLQRILPEPLKLQPEQTLRVEARRVRLRAIREAYQIYKRIAALNNDHVNQVTPRKANVALSCPESVQLGDPITVTYKAPADHPDTDWIGIYEPDVQSVPGHSAGRWQYVPVGPSGTVTFAYEQLPKTPGVFEIRYHTDNNYHVVATVPIQVVEPDSGDEAAAPEAAPRLARKQTA